MSLPDVVSWQPTVHADRWATMYFEQLPNGYWRGALCVMVPGLDAPHELALSTFHNAGEAMEWARASIELFVAARP